MGPSTRRRAQTAPAPAPAPSETPAAAAPNDGDIALESIVTAADLAWSESLRPADFAAGSEERVSALAAIARRLFSGGREHVLRTVGPHDELLVTPFDDEQVWQQLALRNRPLLRFAEAQVRKQRKEAEATDEEPSSEDEEDAGDTEAKKATMAADDDSDNHDEEEDDDDDDEEGEAENDEEAEGEDDDSDEGEDSDGGGELMAADFFAKPDLAEVEGDKDEEREAGMDSFLDGMAEFADEAEADGEEEEFGDDLYGDVGSDEDDGEGEDDGNEEEDGSDEDEGMDEDTRRARRRAAMMDDSDDDDDDVVEEEEPKFIPAKKFGGRRPGYVFKQGGKGLGYYIEGADDAEEDEDEEGDDEEEEEADGERSGGGGKKNGKSAAAAAAAEDSDDSDDAKPESAHAKATKRMAQKLSKLEQAALAEKPWQLTGEVAGSKRPVNSLLEADLDFEQGTKIAPVITEEVLEPIPTPLPPLHRVPKPCLMRRPCRASDTNIDHASDDESVEAVSDSRKRFP